MTEAGPIIGGTLDALGFASEELAARGALIERGDHETFAMLPPELARGLTIPESVMLAERAGEGVVGCGLGSPLLDRLVEQVRAQVPVASVAWHTEPPRLGFAERCAERIVVRNGVPDVLGTAHATATYLAGVFAWTAEADDRYQGLVLAIAHAGSGGEPDAGTAGAIAEVIAGGDDALATEQQSARAACGAAAAIAKRAALAIGPRLDEVGAAVARRRDRERARIDTYFTSLIAEARRPRRQVARDAIEARVAALHAEHVAKQRELTARYALRVRIEPVALAAVAVRVAEVRLRLRRRKGERVLAIHVPPAARAPDALACAGCPDTTCAPILCDDALHVLCEACAPDATGRPRCRACRTDRTRR